MTQTNKLNGCKSEVFNFSQFESRVIVEGENKVSLNIDDCKSKDIGFQIKENSKLNLIIFNLSENVDKEISFALAKGAKLDIISVNLNEDKSNLKISVNLNGEDSNSNINLIAVSDQKSNINIDVTSNNNKPNTISNISQRGVALNGGQINFNATGLIEKDCSKAINFQESKVLLLDKASKGSASPFLLINHHDVEAGHSAGVSRVNDDDMYYLMSRGIPSCEAEKLMTIGFIQPIISKINDQKVKGEVFLKIKNKVGYEND